VACEEPLLLGLQVVALKKKRDQRYILEATVSSMGNIARAENDGHYSTNLSIKHQCHLGALQFSLSAVNRLRLT